MIDSQTFQLAEETQKILFAMLIIGWLPMRRWRWMVATAGWFGVAALIRGFADVPAEHNPYLLPGDVNGIPPNYAIYAILILNLGFVLLIVLKTGGSEISPFTPLYFMLPTFALLILGAQFEVFAFAGLALFAYFFSLFFSGDEEFHRWTSPVFDDEVFVRRQRISTLWMSAACLACVVFIDVRKPILEERMKQRRSANSEKEQKQSPVVITPSPTPTPMPSPRPVRPTARPDNSPKSVNPALGPTSSTPATPATSSTAPPPESTHPASTNSSVVPSPPKPSFSNAEQKKSTSSSGSYAALLKPFYFTKLTRAKRASLLRAQRKRKIDWQVQYESHEIGRREILIYFSRPDGQPLPTIAPVRVAKVARRHSVFLDGLARGQVIRITGQLERHSPSELFVQVSDIH